MSALNGTKDTTNPGLFGEQCDDPYCSWCKMKKKLTEGLKKAREDADANTKQAYADKLSYGDLVNKIREKDDPGYLEDQAASEQYADPIRFEVLEEYSDTRRAVGVRWPDGTVDYRRVDGVNSQFPTMGEFWKYLRKNRLFRRYRQIDRDDTVSMPLPGSTTAEAPQETVKAPALKPSREQDLKDVKDFLLKTTAVAANKVLTFEVPMRVFLTLDDVTQAAERLHDDYVLGTEVYED